MYIDKTMIYRPCVAMPVFLTLKAPYKMVEAGSNANVLDESIVLANLPREVAKLFRCTGATMAIQSQDPNVVMKVGRWKEDFICTL